MPSGVFFKKALEDATVAEDLVLYSLGFKHEALSKDPDSEQSANDGYLENSQPETQGNEGEKRNKNKLNKNKY